jgi:hypothetical protein
MHESVVDKDGKKVRGVKAFFYRRIINWINRSLTTRKQQQLNDLNQLRDLDFITPTHSQLWNAHRAHPLHPLAKRCIEYAIRQIGTIFLEVLHGRRHRDKLLDTAKEFFFHPALPRTPNQKKILEFSTAYYYEAPREVLQELSLDRILNHPSSK